MLKNSFFPDIIKKDFVKDSIFYIVTCTSIHKMVPGKKHLATAFQWSVKLEKSYVSNAVHNP